MAGWDLGLNYEDLLEMLKNLYLHSLTPIRRRNTAVLLVQLYNGSRVSEAVDAWNKFVLTGKREIEVRVRKHKNPDTRLMIIPKIIKHPGSTKRIWFATDKAVKFYAFCLGINTHSLRYARITHLLSKGENPAIVAKIVGHKNLNQLLTYYQDKEARKKLRKLISEDDIEE